MNYLNNNNTMKSILGNNLELMIRDISFIGCKYIDEDVDQIYVVIDHEFGLYKNDDFEDMLDGADEVSEMFDSQSDLYETQLIFNK